jgi:heme/copper-type cytochrome/quinol oxidase subunit 4
MNPLAIILPNQRATPMAFLIGLVLLAALDAVKTWYGLSLAMSGGGDGFGMMSMALYGLMIVFVSFLFINRRRDAGEGTMLFLLPVILAVVVSLIAAGAMAAVASFGLMEQYADSVGRDVMTVAQDPGFQAEFQTWIEERPELAMQMAQPAAWGGFAGFWGVTFIFAFWFMAMKQETNDHIA